MKSSPAAIAPTMEEQLSQCSHLIIAGELAAGVTHKMANVLMAASSTLELLQIATAAGQPLDDVGRVVSSAYDRVLAGATIIQRLQTLANYHVPVLSRVSPQTVVDDAVGLCSVHPLAKKVRVISDADGSDPVAQGDARVLEEVVIGLILQALYASRDGDTIRAGATETVHDDHVEVFVAAEGCRAANLDEGVAFGARSERGHEESPGLNIALLSSLDRISRMSARIEAIDDPGRGAVVSIRLPIWSDSLEMERNRQ